MIQSMFTISSLFRLEIIVSQLFRHNISCMKISVVYCQPICKGWCLSSDDTLPFCLQYVWTIKCLSFFKSDCTTHFKKWNLFFSPPNFSPAKLIYFGFLKFQWYGSNSGFLLQTKLAFCGLRTWRWHDLHHHGMWDLSGHLELHHILELPYQDHQHMIVHTVASNTNGR